MGGRRALPHLAQTPSVSTGFPVAEGVWAALHTGCSLFAEAAFSVPALSVWTWRAREISTAWSCLLIFPEPTKGPWVALPGTWGCVGTNFGQPGSQTTLGPAD